MSWINKLILLPACLAGWCLVSACGPHRALIRDPLPVDAPGPGEDFRRSPPDITNVSPLPTPTVKYAELENGFSVTVIESTLSDTSEVMLVSRRGNDEAWPYLLVRTVSGMGAEQMDDDGAGLRASAFSTTSALVATFHVAPEKTAAAIARLSKVTRPRFTEKDLKKVVASFRRRYDGADRHEQASALARALIFEKEGNFGEQLPALAKGLDSIKLADVRACAKERWVPSDTRLIVVGPTRADDVLAVARQYFSAWQNDSARRKSRWRMPTAQHPPASSDPEFRRYFSKQVTIQYAQKAPHIGSPDRLAFDLASHLIGGSFSSTLNKSLRSQDGSSYGVHAGIYKTRYAPVFYIEAAVDADKVETLLRRVFDSMRALHRAPPAERDLIAPRHELAARHLYRTQHSKGLAKMLQESFVFGIPFETTYHSASAVASLSAKDVFEAVKKHMQPKEGVFVLTGDFSEIGGREVTRNEDGFWLAN